MASMQAENWDMESGDCILKEISSSQTPYSSMLSTSFLRRRPKQERASIGMFKQFLNNLRLVFLGNKLCVLIPAIPLAIFGQCYGFMTRWIFAVSMLGLAPLAERVSFLTEQIAYFTGPTVGGLLNATCGNATELILALFALRQRKISVLKYSLLGSVLSNLLLVLGSSLFLGGLVNVKMEQTFDRKQADVNSLLLLLGLLCHVLPLIFGMSIEPLDDMEHSVVWLSRISGTVMLVAYGAYLFFQLRTHRQCFEAEEEDDENEAVMGFWSAFIWLVTMTITVAILSEYVVDTIEAASDSWEIPVSFISLILVPIVGNAAEHAGSVIFAFKNKLDITLGVALGSATQISMFVVPLCVLVAWITGIPMDLDFGVLETSCLGFSIILTAFTLQDGKSHYVKGAVLCLSYAVIGASFFYHKMPASESLQQR